MPVGWVPRHPERWGRSVPEAIDRARADGRISYLAGVLAAMSAVRIKSYLDEAALWRAP